MITPQNVPQDVLDAVKSVDFADKLEDIGHNNGLHVDQIGILGDSVRFVMFGQLRPDQLQKDFADHANVPMEEAGKIVAEVNEKIFLPIRESLKKMHEGRQSNSTAQVVTEETTPSAHEILSAISNPESIGKISSTPAVAKTPETSNFAQFENPTDFSKPPTVVTNRIPETPPIRVPITAIPTPTPAQTPATTPMPATASPQMNIHEEKLAGPVRNPIAEPTVNNQTTVSIIPNDHKERINSDPYKEKI